MKRLRLSSPRALLAVLAVALLGSALISVAAAGARDEVLVGRYAGKTAQGRDVEFRIERQGDKLVVASFGGSLETCGGGQSATFGTRDNTRIPADGRVELKALGGDVTVSLIIGGPGVVGRIDYSMAGCNGSVRFSAELQPPDALLQAGRYAGKFHGEDTVLTVVRKRGYFELADFSGLAEDCRHKRFGVDVSPDAFVDGDGRADFSALSGRVKVEVRFHHKSHAEGSVTFTEGTCSESLGFAARLKPAP